MKVVSQWQSCWHRRFLRFITLGVVGVWLVATMPAIASHFSSPNLQFQPILVAQAESNSSAPVQSLQLELDPTVGNEVDGYPVNLGDVFLFRVRIGVTDVTAEERANIIAQRILAIANSPEIQLEDIRTEDEPEQSIILADQTVLFTVREQDAQAYGAPHPELAQLAVNKIREGVATYREQRSLQRVGLGLIAAIFSTAVLFICVRVLLLVSSKGLILLQQQRQAGTLALRIKSLQILGPAATSYLLSGLIRFARFGFIVLALYLYVPFVLSQFPATRKFGDNLLQDTLYRLNLLLQAFVAYLPNLGTILVIAIITYYAIQFTYQVILELGRPDVYPWFYAEWIQPTIRLATMLIVAIAIVMASPYLPGINSPAFQGVSLFIGALLTLGSSSAVANALSGIILIYTRAFQLGDYIRIDEVVGEVAEKSLFVTRLLTPKQETVTIPNSVVLNSNVVNYSAICRESHSYLLLHTTITLGYDVPWRTIHDVLVAAAIETLHVQAEPQPFVLQTSLNDYNVSYQLNVYTTYPEKMPRIYSELHQNIQDKCNEAGIEILSPSFSALRDGNSSTIPADYLPPDYTSPAFTVDLSRDRLAD